MSNSHLSMSQIHPPILPSRDHVTELMFKYNHVVLGHCGPTLLLSTIGARVHVTGARRLARATCWSCVTCRRAAARTETQLMGQLPAHCVMLSSPFAITGIDYAGPFTLKKGHTRRPTLVKAYLALFVCSTTKAVHLEIISDLTTEAFLASLKRFIARRGLPTELHSDNGSNFKGAKRDLNDLYRLLSTPSTTSAINHYLLSQRITWHCIPERAPHFGGLWEAAVKSTKFHLKRVIGTQHQNFEEFTTVAAQVKACLNSRPLIATTSYSTDGILALTPGHFLIGRELRYTRRPPSLPTSLSTNDGTSARPSSQHFWRRWSAEYLQQLKKVHKWKTARPNLQPGDIVVIKEDSVFTNHWPIGRVVKAFPGKDGLVRAVGVKTQTTILRRPVAKLALLLTEDQTPPDVGHHRAS